MREGELVISGSLMTATIIVTCDYYIVLYGKGAEDVIFFVWITHLRDIIRFLSTIKGKNCILINFFLKQVKNDLKKRSLI